MKNSLIIFDLDGTLLYTLDDLKNSVNYALNKNKMPERTIDEVKSFIGNGVRILMRRSAPQGTNDEMQEQLLSDFRTHYLAHINDFTRPYDGVTDMIKAANEAGYITTVVSNKLDPAVKMLCKKFFQDTLDDAVGAPPDHKKPDPRSVIDCLTKFDVMKERAIYVGDTEVDIETAHNAGIACVGVSWGFRGKDFLLKANCDYVIDKPDELLAVVADHFHSF